MQVSPSSLFIYDISRPAASRRLPFFNSTRNAKMAAFLLSPAGLGLAKPLGVSGARAYQRSSRRAPSCSPLLHTPFWWLSSNEENAPIYLSLVAHAPPDDIHSFVYSLVVSSITPHVAPRVIPSLLPNIRNVVSRRQGAQRGSPSRRRVRRRRVHQVRLSPPRLLGGICRCYYPRRVRRAGRDWRGGPHDLRW